MEIESQLSFQEQVNVRKECHGHQEQVRVEALWHSFIKMQIY